MTNVDPLAGSPWSQPSTVAGFVQSPPNQTLLAFADAAWLAGGRVAVDIGCGAGRNAVPLAQAGWHVLGTDLSRAMLDAAARRVSSESLGGRVQLVLAPRGALPVATRSADLVIAHGIWNLAPSGAEFRAAVQEAARVARVGAGLFVFTFSRHTLPPEAAPVAGETFVFTQFSGQPQCFVTEDVLVAELGAAGFVPDPALPLRELNRPAPGTLRAGGPPVIFEAGFRYRG